jgi:hypothetical protein
MSGLPAAMARMRRVILTNGRVSARESNHPAIPASKRLRTTMPYACRRAAVFCAREGSVKIRIEPERRLERFRHLSDLAHRFLLWRDMLCARREVHEARRACRRRGVTVSYRVPMKKEVDGRFDGPEYTPQGVCLMMQDDAGAAPRQE